MLCNLRIFMDMLVSFAGEYLLVLEYGVPFDRQDFGCFINISLS